MTLSAKCHSQLAPLIVPANDLEDHKRGTRRNARRARVRAGCMMHPCCTPGDAARRMLRQHVQSARRSSWMPGAVWVLAAGCRLFEEGYEVQLGKPSRGSGKAAGQDAVAARK